MTARLPIPGQDDNTWGTILNDYLAVSLNSDGTLQQSAVTTAGGALDSAVVHNTGNESIGGVKTFVLSPTVPTPTNNTDAANKSYVDNAAASGTPDATSSTKGKVQLTNDFGGTAALPTVVSTHLSSALPVNQGGTGSVSQNFVDLTTSQSVGGTKTFTAAPVVPSNSFPESAVTNLTTDLSTMNTTIATKSSKAFSVAMGIAL